MTLHLGPNRYGKSAVRLATVTRVGDRHRFTDLEIEIRLEGDFEAAHVAGDNSAVLPTDTMRGTCYALAREQGVDTVATYARAVVDRLLEACPAASSAEVEVTSFPWEHIRVDGADHPHTFRPAAGGGSVVTVTCGRDGQASLTGGVRGLRLLKTTGSAFSGFLTDRYTTLPETRDRIMATTVEATWGVAGSDVEVAALAAVVPDTFAARFATHDDSESVQHTLHAMGTAVLDAHADVTWIRFRLPNEHHVLADLSRYGLDNPGDVFVVTDRPFGVIEGLVVRDGVPAPESGW